MCKFAHSISILMKLRNSALRAAMYFSTESIYLTLSGYFASDIPQFETLRLLR